MVERQELAEVDFRELQSCNHFSMFKPMWATNVLRARFIWTVLGRPTPPKSAMEVGRVVHRTKKNVANDAKYEV